MIAVLAQEPRPAERETRDAIDTATTLLNTLVRKSKTPGLQYLAVSRDGVVFAHDAGAADLASARPVSSQTTMMAHSMSKTITAAAVLQLVEAARVGLDDPVSRYVDTPYGHAITVRQLLSHTSGIPNPVPLRWVHPATEHASFDEEAALRTVLRKHPRLAFSPGARYAYSNIGYWLLGRVVERASGEPFTTYVSGHVLRSLDITPEELGYAITDPRDHAAGYLERYSFLNLIKSFVIDRTLIGDYEGRWLHVRDHYVNGPAFGGLVGSAMGFAKFLRDQLQERSRLFGDAARRLFVEPQHTTRGPIAMTLGWHIGSRSGTPFLFKEGGGGGFHSMMRVYPADGIGTVVMANATAIDVRGSLDAVDPRFLGARGNPS
jgi:CubicO group peptidase (beta-lactamase class C family)